MKLSLSSLRFCLFLLGVHICWSLKTFLGNLLAFHPPAALAHTMKKIVNSLVNSPQNRATFPFYQKKKERTLYFQPFFLKLIGEKEIDNQIFRSNLDKQIIKQIIQLFRVHRTDKSQSLYLSRCLPRDSQWHPFLWSLQKYPVYGGEDMYVFFFFTPVPFLDSSFAMNSGCQLSPIVLSEGL